MWAPKSYQVQPLTYWGLHVPAIGISNGVYSFISRGELFGGPEYLASKVLCFIRFWDSFTPQTPDPWTLILSRGVQLCFIPWTKN